MKKDEILTGQALVEKIENAIKFTEKIIANEDWQVKGSLTELKNFNWNLDQVSKNQIKKINRAIDFVYAKQSRRAINRMFYILSCNFNIPKIKVEVSKKEQAIQDARKRWKKAQKVSDELLKQYKEEKGDYFKKVKPPYTKSAISVAA